AHCAAHHHALHSFPTRRSSDLTVTMVGATLRNTANPTRLAAGYKDNVIPGKASATIDCRTLPGQSEIFEQQLREVIGPDIEVERSEDTRLNSSHLGISYAVFCL